MKRYSTSTKMVNMNYKVIAATTPCPKNPVISVSQENHEELLKRIETEDFQRRANIQMNKIVNRFLNYKRDELKQEGYDDDEIESIIEHLLNGDYDEYYEYSSNEDDDSVYSDEDTF